MRNVSELKVLFMSQLINLGFFFKCVKIRKRPQQLLCYCRNRCSGFRTKKLDSCITSINNCKNEAYLPPREM